MRVVIAPDSFGGSLSAGAAADALAAGWRRVRPDDHLVLVPMADGGQGTLEVVAAAVDDATWHTVEVAGPRTLPVEARFLRRGATAIVEVAEACGLHLLDTDQRDPLRTSTYGVGQLLDAARLTGATRLVVGLGGSATVDGGAGALTALGYRLRRGDGSGVKVGGGELHEIRSIEPGWFDTAVWPGVEVELWSDVTTPIGDAARVYGPQKGALPDGVPILTQGLRQFVHVVARDLGGPPEAANGTGAAGGLAYGLAAGLAAAIASGATRVAESVGLPQAIEGADLVVTGEGRLDATSSVGKVLTEVVRLAGDLPVLVVAGQVREVPAGIHDVEAASPSGPTEDAARLVEDAAARLAARVSG